MASTEKIASTTPAAPSRWPVIDLVELTASLLGVLAERALDRDRLRPVAERRRGGMRIDVVDLLGFEPASRIAFDHGQRARPHRLPAAPSCGRRRRSCRSRRARRRYARRAPCACSYSSSDQDTGAITDHEAVPVAVPRAAGALRLIIALRKRLHLAEAAEPERRGRHFGAAGNHRVSITVLDRARREADRMGRRRARCNHARGSGPAIR